MYVSLPPSEVGDVGDFGDFSDDTDEVLVSDEDNSKLLCTIMHVINKRNLSKCSMI